MAKAHRPAFSPKAKVFLNPRIHYVFCFLSEPLDLRPGDEEGRKRLRHVQTMLGARREFFPEQRLIESMDPYWPDTRYFKLDDPYLKIEETTKLGADDLETVARVNESGGGTLRFVRRLEGQFAAQELIEKVRDHKAIGKKGDELVRQLQDRLRHCAFFGRSSPAPPEAVGGSYEDPYAAVKSRRQLPYVMVEAAVNNLDGLAKTQGFCESTMAILGQLGDIAAPATSFFSNFTKLISYVQSPGEPRLASLCPSKLLQIYHVSQTSLFLYPADDEHVTEPVKDLLFLRFGEVLELLRLRWFSLVLGNHFVDHQIQTLRRDREDILAKLDKKGCDEKEVMANLSEFLSGWTDTKLHLLRLLEDPSLHRAGGPGWDALYAEGMRQYAIEPLQTTLDLKMRQIDRLYEDLMELLRIRMFTSRG